MKFTMKNLPKINKDDTLEQKQLKKLKYEEFQQSVIEIEK